MIPAWIGLLIAALLIGAFVVAVIAQRRRKAADKPKPKPHRIPIDGFGDVFVTPKVGAGEAKVMVAGFWRIRNLVWARCIEIYGFTPKTWWVDKIYVTDDPSLMSEDHRHGYFDINGHSIIVLIREGMNEFFAHEVHNVFRFVMHGPRHIYVPVDDDDRRIAEQAQAWIEKKWGLK